MNIIENLKKKDSILANATLLYWGSYSACTAIIAGGKAWTVLTSNPQSVSHLLGTIGKASFRRELAVFVLTSYIAYSAINAGLNRIAGSSNLLSGRAITLISVAGGITCGLVAAALTSSIYTYIKIPMIALGIAVVIVSFANRREGASI